MKTICTCDLRGGPQDGASVIINHDNSRILQQKSCGGMYFWVLLQITDQQVGHFYLEEHPRDEPELKPPSKLTLWHDAKVSMSTFD